MRRNNILFSQKEHQRGLSHLGEGSPIFILTLTMAVVILVLASECQAARVFYVDKNHAEANDSNPGTEALPWLHLNWGLSVLEPGDILYVKGSTDPDSEDAIYHWPIYVSKLGTSFYNGLQPVTPGTAENHIKIEVYPGHTVILQSNGGSRGMLLDNASHYEIRGFLVRNWEFGAQCLSLASEDSVSDLTIEDCEFTDIEPASKQIAMKMYNIDGLTMRDVYVHHNWETGIWIQNCENVLFERVRSNYNSDEPEAPGMGDGDGIATPHADNFVCIDCEAIGNSEDGFDLCANGALINCIAQDSYAYNIKVWRRVEDDYAPKIMNISNCIIANANLGGLYVIQGAELHLYNSVIYGNGEEGLRFLLNGPPMTEPVYSTVINTIIAENGYNSPYYNAVWVAGAMNVVDADHNLYYHNKVGNLGLHSDTNIVTSDPLFVDLDANDFHLQSGSPAIDAGIVIDGHHNASSGSGPLKDWYGAAPDIGAYEIALSAIADLSVSGTSQNSVTLAWTVPGDEGIIREPTRYDIRYSNSPLTEANWDTATQVQGEPVPGDFGARQSFAITALNPGTTYYIGVKTADEIGNISCLSNVISGTTATSGNHAPVLGSIGNRLVNENEILTFAIGATDADVGDTLVYSATNTPTGAGFNPATQTFTWIPTNSQIGTYQVTFQVSDSRVSVSQTITITVNEVPNRPPILAAIGNKSATVDSLLTFTISATDADADTITYSATLPLPTGATLTGQNFRWTPTSTQVGTHNITFIANDGAVQDSETITVTVTSGTNRPPVLAAIGSKSISENSLLTFTISATDPDRDTVTYSATLPLPTGATFSGQTFSWRPGYTQAGTHNITFIASDGALQDSEVVTVTVSNTNRPPVLAVIGGKSANEGSLLSFSLSATDPDIDDTITYSTGALPSGAAFAGSTFAWTPGYNQAGSPTVTFTVSDGHTQDSETVTITVNNTNRAPVLDFIPDKSVNENTLLTFGVSATDPDGNPLSYSATGLPTGATFASQTFSWTPSSSQAGNSCQVTFTADDGQLDDSQIVTITVTDTLAPSVTNLSPAAGSIQAPLNSLITLHVIDAGKGVDAGTVTITLDGSTIYSGDTSNYVSATGNCRRIGTAADYTYAYQSSQTFDFDQTITVAVNAKDLAVNVMIPQSYSFRTEMRSFGQNKSVDSTVEGLDKAAPATVRDSSGDIWAAWHAGPAGSRDIYLAKLSAGSTLFGAGAQITTDAADQCNPAVALGTDDKLYVVWQDNRLGDWDIYGSTSTNGTTWSDQQRITDTNDNQINPAIAVDRQSPNRAHVVWQDDRADNQDIYIATSSNAFVTNTVTPITSNTANQTAPAVAVSSSNTVYVLWTDARNPSNDNDIYGAAGSGWTNVPIVMKAAGQSSPAIAVESTGSILHILWVDQTSGNSDIYYASSNGLPGSPLTGTNLIDDDTTPGAEQTSPAIAVTGSTGSSLKVFACWADERNVSGSTGDTDIYLVQTNAGSGANVLISDGTANSNQTEPAMGTDQCGYPYIVWTDDRGANTEIYFAASTFMQSSALASQLITAASGGTVGTDPASITGVDDVSIVLPAGACPYDVTIAITKIENPHDLAIPILNGYDFGPSGIVFNTPVTVTITMPYAATGAAGVPTTYWYSSRTGALSQQGITDIEVIVITPTLHALRFRTTHLTPFYALLGPAGGGGGGGGGGCSVSPAGQGSIVEFLIPYLGLAVVMAILKLRDARNRSAGNIAKGKS
jgi:hypothetical protein